MLNYLAKCFFIVPTSFNYLSSSDLDENDWETFLQSVFVSDDHNLMSFYIDLTLKMHQSDVSIINANQMFIFKNLDAFSFLLKSYFEHYKLVPSYLSFFRKVIQLGSNKSASLLVDSVIECDNSEKLSRCFNAVFRVASLKIEDAANEDLFELFLRNFITQISQKSHDERSKDVCNFVTIKL